MTQEEVCDTITKVARRLAPKFTFGPYETEDIFQEAFIIGIEGLDKYDEARPLSNFMFTHISNRLKNFKRDNYYRLDIGAAQNIQARKKNINEPIDINSIHSICTADTTTDDAHISEILKIIDQKLPAEYRRDYLKLKANSPMPKSRKALILKVLKEILEK